MLFWSEIVLHSKHMNDHCTSLCTSFVPVRWRKTPWVPPPLQPFFLCYCIGVRKDLLLLILNFLHLFCLLRNIKTLISWFSLYPPRSQACPNCDTKFPTCIVTGRPLMDYRFWMCGTCKHRAYEQEINALNHCPLCHAPVWSPIKNLCINVIPSSLTVR